METKNKMISSIHIHSCLCELCLCFLVVTRTCVCGFVWLFKQLHALVWSALKYYN